MQIQFIGHSYVSANLSIKIDKARTNVSKTLRSTKQASQKPVLTPQSVDLNDSNSIGEFLLPAA